MNKQADKYLKINGEIYATICTALIVVAKYFEDNGMDNKNLIREVYDYMHDKDSYVDINKNED